MSPREIAASYDRITDHWAGESFNKTYGIAQHERALAFLKKQSGWAIDIGCGSSGRIIDLLLAHNFHVEGLDISESMLALARQKHPHVSFHQADICDWRFPRTYDFISAWDSIWHVPLDHQPDVLQKLCRGLSPGGILIFSSGGTDTPDEVTNPCLGVPLYHATPGIPKLLQIIHSSGCICRHLEYDQYPEKHVYLIVQNLTVD